MAVPYSSLHRFAQAHLGLGAPTVTARVAEPPPGEAAEVDFGLLGLWLDPATGRRRRVYGLLVTLCFSRYAFLGKRVEVRGGSRLVRIYHHAELIKVHAPQPPGGRATDYTDCRRT